MTALDALKERLIAEHVDQINKLQQTLSKSPRQPDRTQLPYQPPVINQHPNDTTAQKFHDDFRLNMEKQILKETSLWEDDKQRIQDQIQTLKSELSNLKYDKYSYKVKNN